MQNPRILVLGGYGNFGKRVAALLLTDFSPDIIIAGRSLSKAQTQATLLQTKTKATVSALQLDLKAPDFKQKLQEANPTILIHAAGPFQSQDYSVATICIELKIHYIDLSDGREFVTGITALDDLAKMNEVVVLSGASSVPALSSVIVDSFAPRYSELREIDFGIAPGNKAERGSATIEAILSYTGKPFMRLERGTWKKVYGWQDLHRHYYGDNIGLRLHGNLDIPDLELLPQRYPTLKTVTFYAGLEVPMLHWFMWHMSWLSRVKIIRNWSRYIKPINAMSHWFDKMGTDCGGMYVHLSGANHEYQPLDITWTLVADKGHGPQIPVIPSVIMARKIIDNEVPIGARPCVGLFSLADFDARIKQWDIYYTIQEVVS
ncbi:MAG: saccharopine dehydrogenase family protein [Candidatus Berkiella sp.]